MGERTAYRNASGVERRVRALGSCEVDLGVRGEDCKGDGENGWSGDIDSVRTVVWVGSLRKVPSLRMSIQY